MLRALDNLLNRVTMYRLVLYVLGTVLAWGTVLGFIGRVSFSGWAVIASGLCFVSGAWVVNKLLAWVFRAPAHNPSAYITALILALIVSPVRRVDDLIAYAWIIVIAISSKYVLALHRQHIFNPAAFSVTVTALTISASASWWVGNAWMLPLMALGGWLIVRKLRRWDVVWSFLVAAAVTITALTFFQQAPVLATWRVILLGAPLIFFATVMLTEPATMPPTRRWRIVYGLFVGILFAPQWHIGSWYSTPELALVVGNLVLYIVTRRERYVATFERKEQIAANTYEFVFQTPRPVPYAPGQYMEWTIPQPHADQRGWRRYFTLASSPTEPTLRLGVKFYHPSSTFKQHLLALEPGQRIVAAARAGDFTLPVNPKTKLAFIAGGIGVTPFRSIVKYCLDTHDARSIVLLYACQTVADIAYRDIFDAATRELNLKAVYVLGDEQRLPADWAGERGRITPELITRQIPDYAERLFYISGPEAMVNAYRRLLRSMGIASRRIKTDYFPGYA